jgi:hypothetical protein
VSQQLSDRLSGFGRDCRRPRDRGIAVLDVADVELLGESHDGTEVLLYANRAVQSDRANGEREPSEH